MKNKIIILLIVASLITSCNNHFLDRNSLNNISGSVIWTSDENATMAVNGIYHFFARDTWFDLYSYITNLSPLGYTQIRTGYGISQYSETATPSLGRFSSTWQNFYRIIKYSNDVIKNVPNNDNISSDLGKRLVGEAKFFRGLSYFYLWNLYGGVPIIKEPLPFNKTYLPRSSADDVVKLIISDFNDAIDVLPVSYSSSNIGRASKGAAVAMLGKTFLYDKQWDKAASTFKKLLNPPYDYKLADNFADNFNFSTQGNKEQIFAVKYAGITDYGSLMDNRYGYRNHPPHYGEDYSTASNIAVEMYTNKDGSTINRSGMPNRNNFSNETDYGSALTNWYQSNYANADPRLHASVILPGSTFSSANGPMKLYWPSGTASMDPPGIRTTWPNLATIPIRKYVAKGAGCPVNRNCPTDFILIRFAGILLMYAEAENEVAGPTSDVYSAINLVRERAGIVDLPSGLSQDDMRRNIWLEEFREFAFETEPYFDVIRWKTASTTDSIFGLNHKIYDFRYITVLGKKVFTKKDYLWPIPQSAIDINDKLVQNPGW